MYQIRSSQLPFLIITTIMTMAPAVYAQNLMATLTDVGPGTIPRPAKMSPQDLTDFSNRFFQQNMEKYHIPGASLAIVKKGSIILKKGYGLAEVRKGIAVDADRTLFRLGSVSKLVTVMAIMQLAEQGRLNVNEDVNVYLKRFKIKNPYSNPLTIAHLLSHTSGFDHQQIGRYARRREDIQPLEGYLEENLPQLTGNPGESISYSNYGISLAGFLVEEITGRSFDDFVHDNILRPLHMAHTAFFFPENVESDLAVGYKYEQAHYQPFEPEYLNLAPAGGLLSTAGDMAQFMIAHLNSGRNGHTAILKPESLAEMQRRHFSAHPQMPGWCYGFYENFRNRRRAVMHTGQTRGYSSLLYLIPEEDLAIFMGYNTNESRLYEEYLEHFFDRYYPIRKNEPEKILEQSPHRNQRFSGTCQFHAFPQRTLAKYCNLYDHSAQVEVAVEATGMLHVLLPGKDLALTPVGRGLFKILNEERFVAFKGDGGAEPIQMYLTEDKPTTLRKVAWWETLSLQLNLRRSFYLFFALAVLVLTWSYFKIDQKTKWHIVLAMALCTLDLLFLIGLHYMFDPAELRFGVPTALTALLVIPIITTGLAAALTTTTASLWKNNRGSLLQRLQFTVITMAAFAFTAFLDYWNLLGFRF
ncbi:MAG TPA: serine hydrolase domain-containing protein [bacterium]